MSTRSAAKWLVSRELASIAQQNLFAEAKSLVRARNEALSSQGSPLHAPLLAHKPCVGSEKHFTDGRFGCICKFHSPRKPRKPPLAVLVLARAGVAMRIQGVTRVSPVNGLLPSQPLHLLLGPDQLATGVTDGAGNASVAFVIPPRATRGTHLITDGVQGTALTADCTVRVGEKKSAPASQGTPVP